MKEPRKLAEYVLGLTEELHNLELRMERMSEYAVARMLKEAVQTLYRRGGEEASLTADVKLSRQMRIMHL